MNTSLQSLALRVVWGTSRPGALAPFQLGKCLWTCSDNSHSFTLNTWAFPVPPPAILQKWIKTQTAVHKLSAKSHTALSKAKCFPTAPQLLSGCLSGVYFPRSPYVIRFEVTVLPTCLFVTASFLLIHCYILDSENDTWCPWDAQQIFIQKIGKSNSNYFSQSSPGTLMWQTHCAPSRSERISLMPALIPMQAKGVIPNSWSSLWMVDKVDRCLSHQPLW